MLSRVEHGKKTREEAGEENLLNDLQTISKALYLDKHKPSRTLLPTASSLAKAAGKPPAVDPRTKLKPGAGAAVANEDLSRKDKKSIWNWKASLKALSGVKNRKFNCCFSLQVHSIEGFPSSFDGVSLCVNWKRRDGELVTSPVKVFEGVADFEQKLTHTCLVYGSRSGPHHSAKYEAKHFLLFASVFGMPEVDLGKHRVDLTRLLPLTLEELDEEKSSGKWTTSYKLSGEAKGAVMNVSFGYTVVGESLTGNGLNAPESASTKRNNLATAKTMPKMGQAEGRVALRRHESLTTTSNSQLAAKSRSPAKVKDLREFITHKKLEVEAAGNMMNERSEEEKLDASARENIPDNLKFPSVSESSEPNAESENDNSEVSLNEDRKELPNENKTTEDLTLKDDGFPTAETGSDTNLQVVPEESIDLHDEGTGKNDHNKDEPLTRDSESDDDLCSKESVMKELESMLNSVSKLETEALDSSDEKENYRESETDYQADRNENSVNPDDAEDIANEFLDMLGIEQSPFGLSTESEPESPRELLLRQFENDALAGGFSLFDYNAEDWDQMESSYDGLMEQGQSTAGFDLSSFIDDAEGENDTGTHPMDSKIRAKILEDVETEALMHEWGLNDKTFQCSPPKNCGGAFGAQIDPSPEDPLELPALAEGLGPFLQTKNGGFVRSMNPSLFESAKAGGSLIMQVSSPVVVPAEMGSDVADILQQLASAGIEKLSMQANKLMPLEDITGKTMRQVAWEAAGALEGPERQNTFPQKKYDTGREWSSHGQENVAGRKSAQRRAASTKSNSGSKGNDSGLEYVSLEDLAPLAMDKIEALSMEGLRIQSGVSAEEAPSNISAHSIGEISTLQGKAGINASGSLGLEGAAGLQLMEVKENDDGDVDGLMGLSLTLDEWMRLDSGDIGDEEDQISERTSKILAAHHANSLNTLRGRSKGDNRKRGKKCGLLGNNFTVALMVQLRDPLRDFEPVGTPMLALIQVERVFIPPKPKIYCKVAELRNNSNDEDESEDESITSNAANKDKSGGEVEGIPKFQISEVHVAGLKTEPEPDKKKPWGTASQQQAGSRWLLANGMGKGGKNSFMKSKAASSGDSLWSVSSKGDKLKQLGAANQHKRNPNLVLPSKKQSSWFK
ncbi:unnamed protein product [Linum trigynum]|uniref:C2 NT-type domain-containing protein n=1 Tax=Linum trigynum TaxID=586398 RepID=A0AAV2CLS3_9ROSI